MASRVKVDYDVMYVDKSHKKQAIRLSRGILMTCLSTRAVLQLQSMLILLDNGKSLTLTGLYCFLVDNVNTDSICASQRKGRYIGYTEVIPFQIGDEDILNSTELFEPSSSNKLRVERQSVRFDPGKWQSRQL